VTTLAGLLAVLTMSLAAVVACVLGLGAIAIWRLLSLMQRDGRSRRQARMSESWLRNAAGL
jgi:hypothetical protein